MWRYTGPEINLWWVLIIMLLPIVLMILAVANNGPDGPGGICPDDTDLGYDCPSGQSVP